MSDLEEMVRDAYLVAATSPRDVVDDATAARIIGVARSRRRGRIAGGSLVLAAGVVGVALASFAMASGTTPPAASPSPTVPTAPAAENVNYVATLPEGITGVVDSSTLGTPVASGIVGAPTFYPLTADILAQRGPGWGYTIFGGYDCYAEVPTIPPVLALVSPDGYAFEAATLPPGACTAQPIATSGNLVLIKTAFNDVGEPMYVVNVATGTVNVIETGATYSVAVANWLSGGQGVVAFKDNDPDSDPGALILVTIDKDGGQHRVDTGVTSDAADMQWATSGDQLMFAETQAGDDPVWGWAWHTVGPGDEAAHRIHLQPPADASLGDDCELGDAAGAAPGYLPPVVNCDFDGAGAPRNSYLLNPSGFVYRQQDPIGRVNSSVDAHYTEHDVGESGPLDATVTYTLDDATATVVGKAALEPPATGPWTQTSSAYAQGSFLTDGVEGIFTEVFRPDGGTSVVAVIATPDATTIVLPIMIDGAANAAGRWLWWNE